MTDCPVCMSLGSVYWERDPEDPKTVLMKDCPLCSQDKNNYIDRYKEKKEQALLDEIDRKIKQEEEYKIETGEIKL